jgi:hypothetical protein
MWRQMREEGHDCPDELRPDRSKVIIDADKNGHTHYVRCDPAHPKAWQNPIVQRLLGAIADTGSELYLVTASERKRLRIVR